MSITSGLNKESNGGVAINVQDQTSQPLDVYFTQSISNFTLGVDTVASGIEEPSLVYSFTAATAHGIVAGNEILLLDTVNEKTLYAKVLVVATNVITLDRPIDHAFAVADTLGRIVTTAMNVNGSVTPQIFSLRAGESPLDFTRFFLRMRHTAAGDDGKFGGIAALTRGVVFRIVDSFQKTIFTFKTNGEISEMCFDVRYTDKAGGGTNGTNARISFAGQDKHGVVLRISTGDVLQWVIQDDLTTLLEFKATAQGHLVTD